MTLLVGLVVGAGGAASGVIAALATYQKNIAYKTKDRSMLLVIFDALEANDAMGLLPVRARIYLRQIAGQSDRESDDDDAKAVVDG